MASPTSLFEELKRRNVFRVGLLYVVGGWLLLQVADVLFSVMQLPDWSLSLMFALLALGLPMALVFAWAFEMTPEGLKREHEVDRDTSITPVTGRRIDRITLVVVVIGVLYLIGDSLLRPGAVVQQQPAATVSPQPVATDASVAVLPFADFSAGGDQGHFADGLADTLLHMLAQVDGLRVAARTSSFAFRDTELPVTEIAEQLNVATILEGSVQASDDRLRIIAQLIDSTDGSHLWSGTFDRAAADIFATQDEIANEVVRAMRLEVMNEESRVRADGGTDNLEAYNAYLLGRALIERRTAETIAQSADRFREAIRLDPDYALALAELALSWVLLHDSSSTYGTLSHDAVYAEAFPLLERALEIAPDLSEAHAILGLLMTHGGDKAAARTRLATAIELNPNNAQARAWYSMEIDDPDLQLETLRVAHQLDPVSLVVSINLASQLARGGELEEARQVLERTESLHPGNPMVGLGYATLALLSGDTAEAIRRLKPIWDAGDTVRGVARLTYVWLTVAIGDEETLRAVDLRAGPIAAMLAVASGNMDEPVAVARGRLAERPEAIELQAGLAISLALAGNNVESAELFRKILDRPEEEQLAYFTSMDGQQADYLPVVTGATVLRTVGEEAGATRLITLARRLLEDATQQRSAIGQPEAMLAGLTALEGEYELAIARLADAIDKGFIAGWLLDVSPNFAALRNAPGYEAQRQRIRVNVDRIRAELGMTPLLEHDE